MHKLFFLLLLFILGINGMVLWQSRKIKNDTNEMSRQLTCSLKPEKNLNRTFMLPGSVVLFN